MPDRSEQGVNRAREDANKILAEYRARHPKETPMGVNWLRDTPRGVSVGYDGDTVYGQVQVDQWQDTATFETELEESLDAMRARMLAEQKRLREMDDA